MFIKDGTYRSVDVSGLTAPIIEGTVLTSAGAVAAADGSDAFGIVPETAFVMPPTKMINVVIGGTIDLQDPANANVTISKAVQDALSADINFIPGAGALPVVDSDDNGKFLVVEDGKWSAGGDDVIQETVGIAVSDWLEDHPEATTTIEDGAVTDAKLAQDGGVLSETHDIRTGVEGETYSTAGDAVRGQVSALMSASEIKLFNETFTMPASTTKRFMLLVKKGDILSISTTLNATGIRLYIYFDDGTNKRDIRLFSGFRYRAKKNIVKIILTNGESESSTFTVSIEKSPLYLTNYYDKSKKQSGWINSDSIASGYYHTDFIPCALGDKIIFPGYPSIFGSPVRLMFYDAEKNYLSRKSASLRDDGLYECYIGLDAIGTIFEVADVHYCAFNMTVAGSDNAVCYINNVPYDAVDYGVHLPEDENILFNEIQKEFIGNSSVALLSGKKIAYNGDSIAESRIAEGNTNNGGGYAKMIADITGCTYENRAHGGGILASAVGDGGSLPSRCVVSDVTNMASDADLICFEGGINDYWRQVRLGTYSESDYSSTLDTTTLCGALESIFRQALEKWVGKPICFVITHKIKNTVYVANSAGYTMMEAREKMIGICKKYAIPYYDAFEESGLNAYNDIQNETFLTSNASGTADGCHPNANGYKSYYVPQLIDLFTRIMPRN